MALATKQKASNVHEVTRGMYFQRGSTSPRTPFGGQGAMKEGASASLGQILDQLHAQHDEVAVDLRAFVRAGQRARAEILAERLELAVDAILECRLQPYANDLVSRRDVLFELYEREILTRDQVRARGNLDPSEFFEELHAYRLRHAAT